LDQLASDRGAPCCLRMDNGPEFVAHALVDWCRFNGAGSLFIDPASPWQNGWIESFNARLRDEFLNGQQVRQSLRGEGAPWRLATRIQSREDPQRTSSANAGQVRRDLEVQEPATTRRVSGLGIGVRSPRRSQERGYAIVSTSSRSLLGSRSPSFHHLSSAR
jgi:transposase InsO family protein